MHPAEMNREQRLFLTAMNNRLSGIEKQLRKEAPGDHNVSEQKDRQQKRLDQRL